MTDLKNLCALLVSWVGLFLNLALKHWSVILSTAVGVCAIGASLYSMRLNRMKARQIQAQDERTCHACRSGQAVECPYPEHARPAWCKHRRPGWRRFIRL